MHSISVSEVKILQTSLSQERWGMMLSSKLRTNSSYKSRSPWCWFYLRLDYPLTDKNLYGRAQGLLVLMVSQSICLQTWWIFFKGWLHAPLCGKRKITLWWCDLIWRYESICLLLRQTFSCDSGWSLQTHLQPARPLHLPSLKLGINSIPRSDSHTLTDVQPRRHPAKRRQLQSAYVNKVLPTHRPICLIPFALSLCFNWWIILTLQTCFV